MLHLKERLVQSHAWSAKEIFQAKDLQHLLKQKIQNTDFANAQKDILPFIQDSERVALWSAEFFMSLLDRLEYLGNKN